MSALLLFIISSKYYLPCSTLFSMLILIGWADLGKLLILIAYWTEPSLLRLVDC